MKKVFFAVTAAALVFIACNNDKQTESHDMAGISKDTAAASASADDKDICTWRIEVKKLPSYGGKTLVFNCVLG